MTKIISITRILNEDDIVEAFVRHNAFHVDHMLILDHGSVDRTLEILRTLQNEGFSLTVFQNDAICFSDISINSWAYRHASHILPNEWVLYLGADEFIATPNSTPLSTLLPVDQNAATGKQINYGLTQEDDAKKHEPIIPKRMRYRYAGETGMEKLILRASLAGVFVAPGSNGAYIGNEVLPTISLPEVTFAYYPRRNGWQFVQKTFRNWLTTTAAGQNGTIHSRQYPSPVDLFGDKPECIFWSNFFSYDFKCSQAIEAPLAYLGGELRYWQESDSAMKAVRNLLSFLERLASQHGRLVDEVPQVHVILETLKAKHDFLF